MSFDIEKGSCGDIPQDIREVVFLNTNPAVRRVAKSICRTCVLRADCLEDALERRDYVGVLGGMTGQAREAMVLTRGAA